MTFLTKELANVSLDRVQEKPENTGVGAAAPHPEVGVKIYFTK
jgi:hypothetical protein